MVKLWIDNQEVNVEKGTTILNAAASVGIKIPTLCFLKDLNEIGACRVCIVEIKGKDALVAACNTAVEEGMEIYTNSKRVMNARRTNVGLILSQHDYRCATCVRSGNCSLQKLANDLDILNVPFKEEYEEQEWDMDFPLIRDAKKCIKCMRCVQVCDKIQGMKVWDIINTGKRTNVGLREGMSIEDINCALCGQCITHCPVGALRERDDLNELVYAIADKKKVVVDDCQRRIRYDRTRWYNSLYSKMCRIPYTGRTAAWCRNLQETWNRRTGSYRWRRFFCRCTEAGKSWNQYNRCSGNN